MSEGVLDLSALAAAVESLAQAMAAVEDEAWMAQQRPAVRETMRAGLVQNFEFVYELGVKMMRRRVLLEASSYEAFDHHSFNDLVRTAADLGLVADPKAWFQHRKLRNITSHTYDQAKAKLVHAEAAALLRDAKALLQVLQDRNRGDGDDA